ncbi:MAG: TIGR04282 family arsenosugar biosynthesis glycosyltransferase [Planctomycetota bacterium]
MSIRPDSCLVLMAKTPQPGFVKTRLVPPLNSEQAATLYDAMLRDSLDASYAPQLWQLVIAFWPEEHRGFFEGLIGDRDVELLQQKGCDLPARMSGVFQTLTQRFERVVMRNTDSPQLSTEQLAKALATLCDRDDLVFGPDQGGGYYLVGMSEFKDTLFDAQASTDSNYDETLSRAQDIGYRPHELGAELDVDHIRDLNALAEKLRLGKLSASSCHATREYLRKLGRLS